MKKHICLASGGIILYNLTLSALFGLFTSLAHPFVGLAVFAFSHLLFYLFTHNAYQIVRMDETGIHTRHFSVKWENISEFRYFNIQEELGKGRYPKIPYRSVIGIGTLSEQYFLAQNAKNAVFFSVTKKNMDAIRTLCKTKNATVNEILRWETYSKLL